MFTRLLPFLLIVAVPAFAQSSSGLKSVGEFTQNTWSKFIERSRISYFGEMSGPSAKKWDDNQINPDGTKSREPINMWHSFNYTFKLFGNTSFYMSPRFYTIFGDRNDLKANQDQHVVVMDDWQFGFSQNWIKTDKWSWDTRFSHRAPMSVESKNNRIDSQAEILQVVTWKPIAPIFILSQTNARYYVYENRVEQERYRLNQMTAFNYMFNDKWKVQLFNEFDLQHRNPQTGKGSKDWNYFKKYKDNIAVGVGYNITPNLTVMPFLKSINDTDMRPETTQVGFWVFGRVI